MPDRMAGARRSALASAAPAAEAFWTAHGGIKGRRGNIAGYGGGPGGAWKLNVSRACWLGAPR